MLKSRAPTKTSNRHLGKNCTLRCRRIKAPILQCASAETPIKIGKHRQALLSTFLRPCLVSEPSTGLIWLGSFFPVLGHGICESLTDTRNLTKSEIILVSFEFAARLLLSEGYTEHYRKNGLACQQLR